VVKLLHETRILVADGRIALVLRNEGDDVNPNLKTVEVLRNDANPKTGDLGADRPGRAIESTSGRRSAVEQTDWHDLNEHRFSRRVAAFVESHVLVAKPPALVIVAPPRTLADLRATLAPSVRDKVILELDKDLTHSPLHEIEAHVLKAAKSSK
jgi:protein required for attachment to host cells